MRLFQYKSFTCVIGAIMSMLIPVLATNAWSETDEQGFEILQKSDFDWGDPNRVKTIAIHGNPSKEGLYIIRIRFPAGTSSRPHFHNQDRFITVIEGTWYVGRQKEYDMEKTVPIPAGGFMKHPAGAIHYDGAKTEPVIVEIRGMGPVTTTQVATTE